MRLSGAAMKCGVRSVMGRFGLIGNTATARDRISSIGLPMGDVR